MKSLREHSFRECIEADPDLSALRAEYAAKPAEQRRMAADWEYHSSIARSSVVGQLLEVAHRRGGEEAPDAPGWPDGVLALAIDPSYAPAILTVASIEYQLGRHEGAMALFMTLTSLPTDEPDLPVIIDKAGDFLLDQEDYDRAAALYAAAEEAFPGVAVYPAGQAYSLGKLGRHEEAVKKARGAAQLEPNDHVRLNDLGWTLCEAGHMEEAVAVLERAVALSPPDYDLARSNLEIVRETTSNDPAS